MTDRLSELTAAGKPVGTLGSVSGRIGLAIVRIDRAGEAMAAGTPVIAYQAGGALDYVVPGKTGEFFTEPTVESLKSALQSFNPEAYKASDLQTKAAEFSPAIFRQQIQRVIDDIFLR